jgi:hypothetical protein
MATTDSSDVARAGHLARAYQATIGLRDALTCAEMASLSRDAAEFSALVYAEMLNLYIGTGDEAARTFLHEIGLGERLLNDARVILRRDRHRRFDHAPRNGHEPKRAVEPEPRRVVVRT